MSGCASTDTRLPSTVKLYFAMSSSSGNFQDDLTLAMRRFDGGIGLVCRLQMKAPRKLRPQPTLDHPIEDLRKTLAGRLDHGPLDAYVRARRVRRYRGRGKCYQHAVRLQRPEGAHMGFAA